MTEKLLQYIWQFQHFNQSELTTTAGDRLEIIFPGKWNSDQGPDFTDARIRVGQTLLAGSVELHLKTSQWLDHGHQDDHNYANVILHAVLEHNVNATPTIPVVELQPRISSILVDHYSNLMHSASFVPCSCSIEKVIELTWTSWKERLVAERLTRRSGYISGLLKENNTHWEETFWWLLARHFGIRNNTEAFEAMARSVSVKLLGKHKESIHHLEALLFGQVGMLRGKFTEDYPRLLQREYQFLKKKYALHPIHIPVHFLRMRPQNFPTIRIAQLAALIHEGAHVFSDVLEATDLQGLKKQFRVQANDYWHYHYRFDELSAYKIKTVGNDMADNLVINTIIPMLFAYGLYHKEEKYRLRAIDWLEQLGAEDNAITSGFGELGVENRTAFDSQALLELKTQYCDQKHCLRCAVGNAILKGSED